MKQIDWKKKFEKKIVNKARAALGARFPSVLHIEFDFQNCLLRIVLREKISDVKVREIEHLVRRATSSEISFEAPSVYRFTMHLPAALPMVKYSSLNEIRYRTVTNTGLASMRKAFEKLIKTTEKFDYCATFAMGGMPMLIKLCDAVSGGDGPAKNMNLKSQQRKFHLFPGLSWGKPWTTLSEKKLFEWLDTLRPGSKILFFDITGVGNATNRICNVLEKYLRRPKNMSRPGFVKIVGFVNSKKRKASHLKKSPISVGGTPIRFKFHEIEEIYTEDQAELAGYESLSKSGSSPLWSTTIVRILNSQKKCIDIRATDHMADFLDHLIDKNSASSTPINSPKVKMAAFHALFESKLRRIKNRELRDIDRVEKKKFISTEEAKKARIYIEKLFERKLKDMHLLEV